MPVATARLLHDLLREFAEFGTTGTGGVHRLCASPEDGKARDHLKAWLIAHGATVSIDRVGNMFGLFPLAAPGAPFVMAGSHLDSQPNGGRFDGSLGVAAACCVAATLAEAARAGTRFAANLCVVNWTNEEGARFRPSLLGSGVYAGTLDPAFALGRTDDAGLSVEAALEAIGYRGRDAPPGAPLACLELHIEQGSVLEQSGDVIGIVVRNWAAIKLDLVFLGEQAHTGPYPMERRRDALVAAAQVIIGVRALADEYPGILHSSVGRLAAYPNSSNVVPARVELSVELRSSDEAALQAAGEMLTTLIERSAAAARVEHAILARSRRGLRRFPESVAGLLGRCAAEAGHSNRRMDTVAGHDVISLMDLCPVGLLFVPSVGGISHNVAEFSTPESLEAGLDILNRCLFEVCRTGSL